MAPSTTCTRRRRSIARPRGHRAMARASGGPQQRQQREAGAPEVTGPAALTQLQQAHGAFYPYAGRKPLRARDEVRPSRKADAAGRSSSRAAARRYAGAITASLRGHSVVLLEKEAETRQPDAGRRPGVKNDSGNISPVIRRTTAEHVTIRMKTPATKEGF